MTAKLVQNLQQHMTVLCDQIGERHLGSAGEQQAARYLEQVFRDYGYEVVTETFDAPGWEYGDYSLRIVETGESLPCFPCFYSNACDVTGPVLRIQRQDLAHLDQLKVKDAICLVDLPTAIGEVGGRNQLAIELDRRGAAALIVISNYNDTVNTKIVREPALTRLAVITVSGDTAFELVRNLDRTFRVQVDARTFPTRAGNVVARHQGTGRQRIVIGAHYDTAPGIMGASDNATGTAVLLEIARLVRDKLGDLNVDFVGFSGEEYGGQHGYGLGSLKYVEQHRHELGDIKWMCNIDDVGEMLGQNRIHVGRSPAMKQVVQQVAARHRRCVEDDYLSGSDSMAFHEQGVPTVFICNFHPYWQIHSPKDDLARVDGQNLAKVCALVQEIIEALVAWPEPAPAPPLELVPVEPADLAEIDRIVRQIWTMGIARQRENQYGIIGAKPWQEWIAADVRAALDRDDVQAFVTRHNGKVAGFCTYSIDPVRGIATIGYNGVAPDCAGQGIGSFQIEQLLAKIRAEGVKIVEATTGLDDGHQPARRMYEKCGFREFSRSVTYTRKLG